MQLSFLPPSRKGGMGGFRAGYRRQISPRPSLPKGGNGANPPQTEWLCECTEWAFFCGPHTIYQQRQPPEVAASNREVLSRDFHRRQACTWKDLLMYLT
jgi:hypothetical protein